MADDFKKFRHFSMYVGAQGRKLAEANGHEITLESNDEEQVGDGRILGYSEGVIRSKITSDLVIPMTGLSVDDVEAVFLAKGTIYLLFAIVNGKMIGGNYKVNILTYTGDGNAGSQKGRYEFMGGAPVFKKLTSLGI